MITGIEETLDSGVEICAGDDHERGFIWRVPDDGRVHGGVRVRRGWRPVGAVSRTSFVFPGWCSGERCRRGRRDFRDWRGRSRVFALVDLSRRRRAAVWQYSAVGAASTLAVNAFAFHYAHMTTILSNCKDVTKRIPYTLMNSVKKIALVGPGLVMAMMQLLPRVYGV